MKYKRIRVFAMCLLTFFTLGMLPLNISAVEPRKSDESLIWPEGKTEIRIYMPENIQIEGITAAQASSALNSAIAKWNAEKDAHGNTMLTLKRVYSSSIGKYDVIITSGAVLFDVQNALTQASEDSSPGNLIRVSILINQDRRFSIGAKEGCIDLQSTVQHELGHAIGIAHCHEVGEEEGCFSTTCEAHRYASKYGTTEANSNVMTPILPTNLQRINFRPYDTASYRQIYGEY